MPTIIKVREDMQPWASSLKSKHISLYRTHKNVNFKSIYTWVQQAKCRKAAPKTQEFSHFRAQKGAISPAFALQKFLHLKSALSLRCRNIRQLQISRHFTDPEIESYLILKVTLNFLMMKMPRGRKRMTTTTWIQSLESEPRRFEIVVWPKSTSVP